MPSQVEIVNNALVKLGAGRITSIDDDSKQAEVARAIWAMKRDAELAAYPWTFAMARAELPALADAPAFGWARAFQLPADFLALVEVGEFWVLYQSDEFTPAFQIEGRTVLTDEASPLRVRYLKQITNAGLFPALFAEALSCRLAAEMAESLTQSASKRELAWAEHKQAIREARRRNAIEQPPQPIPESGWIRARR